MESRYWYDERRGYVPLSEFSPLMCAVREAEGAQGWERRHPRQPTIEERAREIMGARIMGCSDEEWDAALAQAENER